MSRSREGVRWKAFFFSGLSTHGRVGEPVVQGLLVSQAVVSARSLAEAKRRLREQGLTAKWFRTASDKEARVVDEVPDGTVAWMEAGEEEWVVGVSVYDYYEYRFNRLRRDPP
jgi:hypothetical protein